MKVALVFTLLVLSLLSGCDQKQGESTSQGGIAKPTGLSHPEWLMKKAKAETWMKAKYDAGGHTMPGSPSWLIYMQFLESEFKEIGMVDMFKHSWKFDRWSTSVMPDHSKWSLAIGKYKMQVANYAAFSGSTPTKGITAPLVFCDPKHLPKDIKGKIVVFKTQSEPTNWRIDKSFETLFTWHDYEYVSDEGSFPPILTVVKPEISVVFDTYYQLEQAKAFRKILKEGKAAGGLFVLNGTFQRFAGIESYTVPEVYGVPVLFIDEKTGREIIAAAKNRAKATLKLEAKVAPSALYQLYGYLPGKNYGKENDEYVLLCTHTDGPSISQENGALGLLGVASYFSQFPQSKRDRTLLLYLDSRHYYPGGKSAAGKYDFVTAYPDIAKKVVASLSMEQLGQFEFREKNGHYERTGFTEGVMLWTRNNQKLVDAAISVVHKYELPRTRVTNVERKGVNGKTQGLWYGVGAIALAKPNELVQMPTLNVPGFSLLGAMGGYWTTMSQIENFDISLFVKQVSAMTELTELLLKADLKTIKPEGS